MAIKDILLPLVGEPSAAAIAAIYNQGTEDRIASPAHAARVASRLGRRADDDVIEFLHANPLPRKSSGDHAHSAAAGCSMPARASRAPSLSGCMKSMPMIPPTSMIAPHIP